MGHMRFLNFSCWQASAYFNMGNAKFTRFDVAPPCNKVFDIGAHIAGANIGAYIIYGANLTAC